MSKFSRRKQNQARRASKQQGSYYTKKQHKQAGSFLAPTHKVNTSGLETKVSEYLANNNIKYVHQYKVDRYFYDFLIGDSVLLEVHGSYYHSDPRYTRKNKKFRYANKQKWRDKKKARVAIQNGFRYRVIWEIDIEQGNWWVLSTI